MNFPCLENNHKQPDTMIDTHQHLIYPEKFNYPWTDGIPPLQKPFRVDEYRAAADGIGIESTVFMEVDVAPEHSAAESLFFCQMADDPESGLVGVIAAARPENEDFASQLDTLTHPRLKGIRRVLHTQPDELSQSTLFRQNLRLLADRSLPFDLCVLARQLPLAIELVDECPQVSFVLDHCGVPDIAGGDFETWSQSIGQLAQRPNVSCKISGLPTYCAPGKTGPEILRPWVEKVITCFGWKRVVWGGDWPVCILNDSLRGWADTLAEILKGTSEDERSALYRENARRIYHLVS